jgi:branched-chain amino acid transport system substrate-binding protein
MLNIISSRQAFIFLGIAALVVVLGAGYFLLIAPAHIGSRTVIVSVPMSLSTSVAEVNSITLAFEEHGYKAGDIPVKLLVLDDGDAEGAWTEEKERANAEAAAADLSVIAYLGPDNSGAAKVSLPILNRAGIAQVSNAATWPGLTKSGYLPGEPSKFYPSGARHFFRVVTTDDNQGPAAAKWARQLGFGRVYVVDDGEAYGAGIAALFAARAKQLGIEVVGTASLQKDTASFATEIDEIRKGKADLVYYGGITPNGGPELLKEMRAAQITAVFMGPDGIFEDDFIKRAGEAAEGVLVTTVGAPIENIKIPAALHFREAYKARYNEEPDVWSAFSYEAANVLLAAIAESGGTRYGVLSNVRATKNFQGLFGEWGFDENGDTTLTLMSGNVVRDGEFQFTDVLSVDR